MALPLAIATSVPLAPHTTFGLGGAARFFVEARQRTDLAAALAWAGERDLPVFILGGGSNLVVADAGFPGLVVQVRATGQAWRETERGLSVEVEAGEPWDDVVLASVRRGLGGLACLSGIPGSAGAAPVQNIGAYGHEVGERLARVRVLDHSSLAITTMDAAACGFGYRDSIFKREPGRYVIVAIELELGHDAEPALRYAELSTALRAHAHPSPAQVRETVLALRRNKSMVYDPADENHRSAGSFFTNPIVDARTADDIVARALADGVVSAPEQVPRFTLPDGRAKLAAGWLIERAGLVKGFRMGSVGLSTRHALALVHHGGGRTADLVRLALHVRTVVHDRFRVRLTPEPVFLGLDWPATDA